MDPGGAVPSLTGAELLDSCGSGAAASCLLIPRLRVSAVRLLPVLYVEPCVEGHTERHHVPHVPNIYFYSIVGIICRTWHYICKHVNFGWIVVIVRSR